MNKKTLILLILILIIAAFFRLWKLNEIPPGLYPDVALNGTQAFEALKTKDFKVFYPENNGREGLMMWLIALSFSVFGVSIWSMKIVAAFFGILTVLGLFLLVKELFNDDFLAFLASFFLATSFVHTNFSRIGFRAILLPFVLVFAFYFLFSGFKKKKILYLIVSGIFLGVGFYTYTSYRFAVLLLFLVLICWWFIYKRQGLQKKYIIFTILVLFVTFIIALPIGIYFLKNPQDFLSRASPISVFAQKNPIKAFLESLILHLGMFNFHGDGNWRHNFSGSPMLPWPLGILFLIGIIISIKESVANFRNKNLPLFTSYILILSWLLVMMLPGILTAEGAPHFLRTIGVIPVTYIFVGVAGEKIYQFLGENTRRKKLLIFTCLLLLIAISLSEFEKYFSKWGQNKEVQGAFTVRFLEMGNYLNSLPESVEKYVIVNESGVPVPWPNGIPMPAQTIMFAENAKYGNIQSTYLLPDNLNQIKINSKRTVILPMEYDEELFKQLSEKFPQSQVENQRDFVIYKINF